MNFLIWTFESRRFSKFFVDLTPYCLCAESLVCILFKRGVQICFYNYGNGFTVESTRYYAEWLLPISVIAGSPCYDNYGNGFGVESTRYYAEWLLRGVTVLPSA
jgi:hypothetical protein